MLNWSFNFGIFQRRGRTAAANNHQGEQEEPKRPQGYTDVSIVEHFCTGATCISFITRTLFPFHSLYLFLCRGDIAKLSIVNEGRACSPYQDRSNAMTQMTYVPQYAHPFNYSRTCNLEGVSIQSHCTVHTSGTENKTSRWPCWWRLR